MLLQGPVGPFFRELRQHLVERGFDVIKVNFSGGDWLFGDDDGCLNFRGSPSQWSAWLRDFMAARPPAAIVMFGDGRPYHAEALRVAGEAQVAAWCLEEGYIRPHYVTCERDGNNARSPLLQGTPAAAPPPAEPELPIGNSFGAMATYATLYQVAQALLTIRFRGNARHRQRPVVTEAARWTLNLVRKLAYHPFNRRVLDNVLKRRLRDYYVVALQVHDDLNLLRNGNGWTMARLIEEALQSFARHAPADSRLLFKVHPLDRGHRPYRRMIAKAARAHGCGSRVIVVDDGPIGPMIRHCEGVITVNSTSGLLALRHGKPLLALGSAVYSAAALQTLPPAHMLEFHAFWRRPKRASREAVDAFLGRMHRESLVGGSFYLAPFRPAAAAAIAERVQDEFTSMQLARLLAVIDRHVPSSDETGYASLGG